MCDFNTFYSYEIILIIANVACFYRFILKNLSLTFNIQLYIECTGCENSPIIGYNFTVERKDLITLGSFYINHVACDDMILN
jgi:hypothetical protein